MKEIRNILLVGRTGQGKSALANLLINQNNNFEEIFKESDSSISQTKKSQTETFEENGIVYKVIDTPSFNDTDLNAKNTEGEDELLYKLAQIADSIDGVNQILFVTGGRFTEEEAKVIGGLLRVVFDKEMINYLTIVRTNFPNFEDRQECKNDWNDLIKESGGKGDVGSQVVREIGIEKFIYLDNPPFRARGRDVIKDTKELSRSRLLEHLGKFSSRYEPENLVNLNKRIEEEKRSFGSKKEEIQKQIRDTKEKLESLKTREVHSNEIGSARMISDSINYSSQLSELDLQWNDLLKEEKKAVIKLNRSTFDTEIIRWSAKNGSDIVGEAIPIVGRTIGGAIGYATGVGSYLLNGVVDLFQGSSREITINPPSNQVSNDSLLLAQISELRQQLSASQGKVLELVSKNSNLQRDLGIEREKRINSEKERDSKPDTKLTLAQIQNLEARPNITLKQWNDSQEQVLSLTNKLNSANNRVTNLENNNQELKKQISNLTEKEKELANQTKKIQLLQGELEQARERIKELEEQSQDSNDRGNIEALKTRIEKLEAELAESESNALTQQEGLVADNEQLKLRLKNLEEEIQKLKADQQARIEVGVNP